jgi:hypothetical protein
MAHDTLVILCKNLNDAIIASNRVQIKHDSRRLFIFLGKKPTNKDLTWMSNTDSAFTLEKAIEWSSNPEMLGIRAGLMFATGWDLIFMWAHDCPTAENIEWIKSQLKIDGQAKLANVWGMTRDYYILYGLGEKESLFIREEPMSEAQLGLEIANALDGKACKPEIAFVALEKTVAVSPVFIHSSALQEKHQNILGVFKHKVEVDNEACISAIIGEDGTSEDLDTCRSKIANYGVVMQFLTQDAQPCGKPYKTINLVNGDKIVVYGKR